MKRLLQLLIKFIKTRREEIEARRDPAGFGAREFFKHYKPKQ